jgi:porphobilinogen synthase
MSQFPVRRMRRLRRTEALRRLVRETHLAPSQLVWPLFVCHGEGVRREVAALPGVYQTSVDELVKDAERARRLGLGGIILFGLPATKDATGSEAYDDQGIVQQAIRAVKRAVPELLVIGDVCLCEYTDHGHCGVLQDGEIENDASVYLLGKVAVTQARAGADIVAPSDMMDGRVAGIRKALDAAGLSRVPILSYAAKMASAFYGPFREAAGSAPQFGDRQSYQMQATNGDEAMKEIRLDVDEGADIVMVKPALPCLDLIRRAKEEFGAPLAAYQVSGEYAMIKAAAAQGMVDETRAMWETLYAIRRAGADIILTYGAAAARPSTGRPRRRRRRAARPSTPRARSTARRRAPGPRPGRGS